MTDDHLLVEVLKGIDQRIADSSPGATEFRIALRHLREIVEKHKSTPVELAGETVTVCGGCVGPVPCLVLLSLASSYAPQALKEMEAGK